MINSKSWPPWTNSRESPLAGHHSASDGSGSSVFVTPARTTTLSPCDCLLPSFVSSRRTYVPGAENVAVADLDYVFARANPLYAKLEAALDRK